MIRLVTLMKRAIAATGLNLSAMTVLTEAASGAYGVTAVIAAMAGARHVYAFTRSSRYGSVPEVNDWTLQLANAAGVAGRIGIIEEISPDVLGQVEILTNSGHLRPLTSALIKQLPSYAVIALMFEAWEFRPEDIDLQACAQRGIPVVGINERHKAVDVFSFLGPLCAKQLHDCGLAVYGNRIALVCDNGFAEPIMRGLVGLGANVDVFADVTAVHPDEWDAAVVALLPAGEPRIGLAEAGHLAAVVPPEAVIVQFWGDVDRHAAISHGLNVWPMQPPTTGHMAILLSEIGPEAIVRLQTGGLRAAEWIRRDGPTALTALRSLVECCNVLGVIRAADDLACDPVRICAAKHGVAVWTLNNLRELPGIIVKLHPEAVVISSFNRILSPDVLSLSRFINVHYSPLPQYRGRANVNWAIINGERAAAISIHLVSPGLYDGNILFQEQVPITQADNAQSLYESLNAIQERELGLFVIRAIAGHPGSPQDHRNATYGCGRVPDDGEIDWSRSSAAIDRLIRALSPPSPGAFTHLEHRQLVIVRAETRNDSPSYVGRVSGRVVNRSRNEEWVDVLTGDGIIRLFEVSSDFGVVTPAAVIIRSTRVSLGLSRLDLLRCINALEMRLAALEVTVRA